MKNKILLSLVACFIAAGSFIHSSISENNHNTDISLADIAIMAQADGEAPGWGDPAPCYWHYKKTWLYNPYRIIVCGPQCCREKSSEHSFLDTCIYTGCDNT